MQRVLQPVPSVTVPAGRMRLAAGRILAHGQFLEADGAAHQPFDQGQHQRLPNGDLKDRLGEQQVAVIVGRGLAVPHEAIVLPVAIHGGVQRGYLFRRQQIGQRDIAVGPVESDLRFQVGEGGHGACCF